MYRTLRSTLHVWLDAFPEDFRDPPEYPLLNQFLDFCERQAKDTELHFKVKHRMERLIKNPEPDRPHFSVDRRSSPAAKRILATPPQSEPLTFTPDAASSPSGLMRNGGSSGANNGLAHSLSAGDLNEAGLHAILLETPERHIAEQLTRLDTVNKHDTYFSIAFTSQGVKQFRTRASRFLRIWRLLNSKEKKSDKMPRIFHTHANKEASMQMWKNLMVAKVAW